MMKSQFKTLIFLQKAELLVTGFAVFAILGLLCVIVFVNLWSVLL